MELKPHHKVEKIIFILIILTIIPLCYPLLGFFQKLSSHQYSLIEELESSKNEVTIISSSNGDDEKEKICEIYKGEWVPNPEAPYYTNATCWAIHEHQNCMKFGRPDSDFIKWKWKPYGCQLASFDPLQFLEIVRGKSMAFVGDSVGRNHMQSLICLLSRVEYPIDVSTTSDEQFKTWRYPSYNFTMATFWSPHLIKSEEADTNGPTHTGLFNLYLDEPDPKWTTQIDQLDYLIINSGHWFFRPSIYYENNQIIGCRYCLRHNVTDLPMSFGYKRALRTAFKAINGNKNYKGITFVRTFAPSHFENGEWDKGGNCKRTRPLRSDEVKVEGVNLEFYETQVEEFKVAERQGKKKLRLIDSTKAMLLRGDGHPSKYGHLANENLTLYNDCVHWCLPGPIDTWNDFLLHMMKIEDKESSNYQHTKLLSSDRKMKFIFG